MQCPVLGKCVADYARRMHGTEPVPTCLRASSAMSGSDIAYAGARFYFFQSRYAVLQSRS
eukprot:470023-Rhodomonas_salina.1